jgi:hypothetical protein
LGRLGYIHRMRALRPHFALLVLAAAACDTESHQIDASAELDDDASSASVDAATPASDDDAAADPEAAAPEQADAQPDLDAHAGLDAAVVPSDAGRHRPGDASIDLRDSAIQPCDFVSDVADSGCTGFVCTAEGGVYAALEQGKAWYVGGLNWNGALCRRVLGWPSGMTADTRYILYGLTPRDQLEVDAGVPIFVYWGSGFEGPDARALRCSIAPAENPLPACPATPSPPNHVSLQGCRSPTQRGCAVCSSFASGRVSYRSAQPGSDHYDAVWPFQAAPCAPHCPSCASCTLHDEQRLIEERRPECEPCPSKLGIDPCFSGDTCECYCSQFRHLASICPTLVD